MLSSGVQKSLRTYEALTQTLDITLTLTHRHRKNFGKMEVIEYNHMCLCRVSV